MKKMSPQLVGMELYFDHLEVAQKFYVDVLGLKISDEQPGHHAKFNYGAGFICLEQKGSESYPSQDKAVLFFQVDDLRTAVAAIGEERIIQSAPGWAVHHDPEGHNVILLQH